ncbi:MAG: type II secretion system F family protein [Candidatus Taylorbacteria bacterium]|nr:type II secretion system F family protein [Candidatus Taylorbacteria bacterium]
MLFNYEAIDATGAKKIGSIDAVNTDIAISSLQRRGLVLTSIKGADEKSLFSKNISLFERVSSKDIVILSRQLSSLFNAQISALRIFRLLSSEIDNHALGVKLTEVADDLQSGNSISASLAKHPKVFGAFYVNMVKAGEESGKLNEIFEYLADYLDRSYELTSKVRGALIYPAFIVFTFFTVMILMFTMVIPKISPILIESGVEIPIYTKIIIGMSNFLVSYGYLILGALIVGIYFLIRFVRTPPGKYAYDRLKLNVPYLSILYKKLYLSRFADNMNTMLISGIPMVQALQLTSAVIDNKVYEQIINDAVENVKGGKTLSDSLSGSPKEIPGMMTQMMRVGEEAGEVGSMLKTMANFYTREVSTAVDSLVSLIEPAMIVMLGLGVAILLAAVLVPIYSIAQGT